MIGNPKLWSWCGSWKSVLNFFSWTERAIDSKFIGSIEVTCRSTVAKIILKDCCHLVYVYYISLPCIKSWFLRNHLAIYHRISHWSYCWNVIESLFKWSRSIDCHVIIFFFKIKNCLNDDLLISCNDRIGKMLHNICISALAMSLGRVAHGPHVFLN